MRIRNHCRRRRHHHHHNCNHHSMRYIHQQQKARSFLTIVNGTHARPTRRNIITLLLLRLLNCDRISHTHKVAVFLLCCCSCACFHSTTPVLANQRPTCRRHGLHTKLGRVLQVRRESLLCRSDAGWYTYSHF